GGREDQYAMPAPRRLLGGLPHVGVDLVLLALPRIWSDVGYREGTGHRLHDYAACREGGPGSYFAAAALAVRVARVTFAGAGLAAAGRLTPPLRLVPGRAE